METAVSGATPYNVDPSKVATVGDANFLEIQKTLGAGFKELEELRSEANKIESDGVDVRT